MNADQVAHRARASVVPAGHGLVAVALAGAALLGGLAAPVARAVDCPGQASGDALILAGRVVFVGTVTAITNSDRWATVRVEERWNGAGGLGDQVAVHGGPDPGLTTPTDRTYELGRYLFVVSTAPGYLWDDACTGTQPWSASLARLRPPTVQPNPDVVAGVPPSSPDFRALIPQVALWLALAIAVVSYLVILRGRRRPPDWFR
jgi:hypothetical protein